MRGPQLAALVLLVACGASSNATHVEHPWTMPRVRAKRLEVLEEFGRRAHRALATASLSAILLDEDGLEAVLDSDGYARFEALRMGLGARVHLDERHGAFAETEFSGLCVLRSREEDAHAETGLDLPGWIFDRALVVGDRGGRRLGAWLEGTFLYTDHGIFALDLTRVEEPRSQHSDIELVQCDQAVGWD